MTPYRRALTCKVSSWSGIGVVLAISACNPYTYQPEVTAFGRGVDQATIAFQTKYKQSLAVQEQRALGKLAVEGWPVEPVDLDCGDVAQSGPLSPAKTTDLNNLPDVERVAAAERRRCALGVVQGENAAPDPAPIAQAQASLDQYPKLLAALRGYSDALSGIVDASDRSRLEQSIGRGQAALEGLASAIDPKGAAGELPGRTSMIAEAFRFALVTGLDQQRFRALRAAVRAANPAVQDAAKLLEAATLQFVAKAALDALVPFEDAIQEMRFDHPTGSDWLAAYRDLEQKRDEYLRVIEAGGAFQAMAGAHQQLADELANPGRGTEALRVALRNFLDRAQVAYELFA